MAELSVDKQGFIVYERAFFDLLGIMLFRFVDQEGFFEARACLPSGAACS